MFVDRDQFPLSLYLVRLLSSFVSAKWCAKAVEIVLISIQISQLSHFVPFPTLWVLDANFQSRFAIRSNNHNQTINFETVKDSCWWIVLFFRNLLCSFCFEFPVRVLYQETKFPIQFSWSPLLFHILDYTCSIHASLCLQHLIISQLSLKCLIDQQLFSKIWQF